LTGALEDPDRAPLRSRSLAGSRSLFVCAALLLFAAAPPFALAKDASTPPSLLGRDPQVARNQTEWHLHIGQAYRDTVAAEPSVARTAAIAALEDDQWVLEPSGAVMHVLTQWKPIHHLLFRIFSGKAFARIFIDVRPLTRQRSEIRFQGILATHRDIEHNPAKGWAERRYASAVRDWQREVHDGIARLTDPRRSDR
jgi:hypothetical protein